ncbi:MULTISPECIES: cytochrome P450 [unclassified Micromonospora]|uniref:cytochrome P450 n=1 Tax=unclassified Micromonospora TaxID=2617518 RepID=UPI001C20F91A|nr:MULTISPECIES: cytochrome P450 [unclassified Micromonospora]MBU8859248.1 cytochrome P450 [Micromonospora sp. WMMB482]MDM4778760.1 cytochrome P450 [Micromonospora sp. b486]
MFDYDPLSPAMVADPYPWYAELRQAGRVRYSERLRSWLVPGYDDCRTVLSDTARFASDWRRVGEDAPDAVLSMQELDLPEHGPIRRLFTTVFRRQDLAGIGEAAYEVSRDILRTVSGWPRFDFTTEVAQPVALFAVCRLLGVPEPKVETFAAQVDALNRGMDAGLLPELREPAVAARAEINELIASWHREAGGEGLLADVLAGARAAGVSEQVVWNTIRVMFLAGFSTTVGAVVNAVLAMAEHPELVDVLRESSTLHTAADEFMRFDGPVQGTSRAVVVDTELAGVRLRRGDSVLMLFAAANRDPAQFDRPDELLPARSPNRHLGMGWGPHACTGAILARLIMTAVLRSLVELPAVPVQAGAVVRTPRATLRYPDHLPLAVPPRERS